MHPDTENVTPDVFSRFADNRMPWLPGKVACDFFGEQGIKTPIYAVFQVFITQLSGKSTANLRGVPRHTAILLFDSRHLQRR